MVLTPQFLLRVCLTASGIGLLQKLSRCLLLLAFKQEQLCAVCLAPVVRGWAVDTSKGWKPRSDPCPGWTKTKQNRILCFNRSGRRQNFRGGVSRETVWSWQIQSNERRHSRPSETEHVLVRGWKRSWYGTAEKKRWLQPVPSYWKSSRLASQPKCFLLVDVRHVISIFYLPSWIHLLCLL